MRNKFIYILPVITLITSCDALASTVSNNVDNPQNNTNFDIALITEVGSITDGGFNEGCWEGIRKFSKENNKVCTYYQLDTNKDAVVSTDIRVEKLKQAIKDGVNLIVTPGSLQGDALRIVAKDNPNVKFIFVDGWNVTDTIDNNYVDVGNVLKNITAINYKEEESGYMAGYAAIKEGYTKLGGVFGGGGTNAAVNRYAYGYLQGINAASYQLEGVEVKISYKYGKTYSSSSDLVNLVKTWYTDDTEVVFSCGGKMFNSVVTASSGETNKKIIGVDVDQKFASINVITSAIKGVSSSIQKVLKQYYNNEWDSTLGGKTQVLGANDDATGIAYHSDRLKTFTSEDYEKLLSDIKSGVIEIKNDSAVVDSDNVVISNANTTEWINKVQSELTNINIIFE